MKSYESGQPRRSSTRVSPTLLLIMVCGIGLPAIAWGILDGRRTAANAEATIRRDLDGAGLDWAQVRVERGQALLTGSVPASGAGSRALDVARKASCRKMFREGRCVRTVRANFGITERENESWPDLAAYVEDGVLTLTGSVPDLATRATVLESARQALRSPRVDRLVDDVTVAGLTSPAGIKPLLRRVTIAIALCNQGRASVADGRTRLRCDVPAIHADSVRTLMATPLPTGVLDVLEVTSPNS